MTEHRAEINGINVVAAYSDQSVSNIFLPFLNSLADLQRQKNRRILVMLAAPPGAGKSTLLSFLSRLSKERCRLPSLQAIGIDGFHRRQEYLLTHDVMRGGKSISMVEIKGAPVTFDLERLKAGIQKIASGQTCRWPVYDRMLHNPVEDAVTIDGDIILLEGNYLLLEEEGWTDLSAYADYTVSIAADENFLRSRLISRRMKTGVGRDAAVRFVDFSDMPNVRLCLEKSKAADLALRIDSRGEYHCAPSRPLAVKTVTQVQAWELGAGSRMEKEMIRRGKMIAHPGGTFELFTLEAAEKGQLAGTGDFFKVDELGFPHPYKRDLFLLRHQPLGDNWYREDARLLQIWRLGDPECEELRFLLDNRLLSIHPENKKACFTAPLWGTVECAPSDAVIVFYGVGRNPDGSIRAIDFNFVDAGYFSTHYTMLT